MKLSPHCLWQMAVVTAAASLHTNGPLPPPTREDLDVVGRVADSAAVLRQPKSWYDRCSHPFHSWQCGRSRIGPTRRPFEPSVTTLPSTFAPRYNDGFFPQATPSGRALADTTSPAPAPKATGLPLVTSAPRQGVKLFPDEATPVKGTSDPVPFSGSPSPRASPLPNSPRDRCSNPFLSRYCPRSIIASEPLRTRKGADSLPEGSFSDGVQLLPKAPSSPSATSPANDAYDKCSHPFHSWLCQPRTTRRLPVLPVASKPQPSSKVLPEPSPSSSPLTSPTAAPYDKCSHPFHSWLCQNPTKPSRLPPSTQEPLTSGSSPNRKAAKDPLGKVLPNEEKPASSPPSRPRTRTKPSWDGADPCTHSFHSWLCKPLRSPSLLPLSTRPPPPPPPPPPPQPAGLLDPNASFQSPEAIAILDNSLTTGTPTPSPIPLPTLFDPDADPVRRKEPKDLDPQPELEPALPHICTHPFHSFLCRKPQRSQPRLATGLARTTSTSTPALKGPVAVASFPVAQMEAPEGLVGSADPIPTFNAPPVAKKDKCSHPFHAWLCGRSRSREASPTFDRVSVGLKSQNVPLQGDRAKLGASIISEADANGANGRETSSSIKTFSSGKSAAAVSEDTHSFPALPSIPAVPTVPNIPTVPTVPTVPPFSAVPTVPTVPTVPAVPTVPTVPTVPAVPTVPTIPTVPTAVQSLPSASGPRRSIRTESAGPASFRGEVFRSKFPLRADGWRQAIFLASQASESSASFRDSPFGSPHHLFFPHSRTQSAAAASSLSLAQPSVPPQRIPLRSGLLVSPPGRLASVSRSDSLFLSSSL